MRDHDPELWQPIICSAQDGLTLFARDYSPRTAAGLPVICLPGLARHSADFHEVAVHLSRDSAFKHRVIAVDYRGRGRSGYDRNWENYSVATEAADLLTVLTVAGIDEAIILGTSRGGLIAMVLGATRPALLRGVIMNDIGPVLDGQGLARIRQYLGKLPQPRDWDEAISILRTYANTRFSALGDSDWRKMAERTWKMVDGRLIVDYDPALGKGLQALDLERPLPPLWEPFTGLTRVPMLVIRGENSDILSAETVAEMQRHHPDCTAHIVPGQGHAPLLADIPTLQAISRFCARIDRVH